MRMQTHFILTKPVDINVDTELLGAADGIVDPLNRGVLIADAILHALFVGGVVEVAQRLLDGHRHALAVGRIVRAVATTTLLVDVARFGETLRRHVNRLCVCVRELKFRM